MASRYPNIVRAARQILASPATSASSERSFSDAGFVINKWHVWLAPSTLQTAAFSFTSMEGLPMFDIKVAIEDD